MQANGEEIIVLVRPELKHMKRSIWFYLEFLFGKLIRRKKRIAPVSLFHVDSLFIGGTFENKRSSRRSLNKKLYFHFITKGVKHAGFN